MFKLLSELTILVTIGKVKGEGTLLVQFWAQSENGQFVKVHAFPQ